MQCDGQITTHKRHSDMDLNFPKPDSRDELQTTQIRHQKRKYNFAKGDDGVATDSGRNSLKAIVSPPNELVKLIVYFGKIL